VSLKRATWNYSIPAKSDFYGQVNKELEWDEQN